MFKDYFTALLHEKPCHFLLIVRAYVQGMERVARSENMLLVISGEEDIFLSIQIY